MPDFMKGFARPAAALALVVAVAASAGAQQPASAAGATAWRAWLGCWSAGGPTPLGADASQPLVCITPGSSADVAQLTTIADGKVISSQTVDASGREVPLDAKGCTGTQTARWSADARRVYLTAVATCDGAPRTTTGLLAISPEGEWLDVQAVKAGESENVRVARYRDIGMRSSVPVDIAETLRNTGFSVASARAAAGADIGTTAVVEAAKATSVGVAEAFVLERGQRFSLDARELVALADAGVSTRLTDAMIAVSNPRTFAVRRPVPVDTMYNEVAGRRIFVTLDRYQSPWGWGYSPYGYSRYGYDPYGYGYGYGYNNYGGYGGYGYPGYVYGGPVVIVRGGETAPHGRVVKGGGYERGDRPAPAASERGVTRARDTSSDGATSRSSGASSSGASSSGSSSSSSSERTAKPRP